MYQLDLADPRLAIPGPVYQRSDGLLDRFTTRRQPRSRAGERRKRIAFFAPDRPGENTVPVCQVKTDDGHHVLRVGNPRGDDPPRILFHALPVDAKPQPKTAQPLYEFSRPKDNRRAYSTDPSWSAPDFDQPGRPICQVWRNPGRPTLPAAADR